MLSSLTSIFSNPLHALIGLFVPASFNVGSPLHVILVSIGLLYFVWICFIAVMALKIAKEAGTLTKADEIAGAPILLVGVIADIFANFTAASLLFLQPPQIFKWSTKTVTLPLLGVCRLPGFNSTGFTITERLQTLVDQTNPSWRRTLALWIAEELNSTSGKNPHVVIPAPELANSSAVLPTPEAVAAAATGHAAPTPVLAPQTHI